MVVCIHIKRGYWSEKVPPPFFIFILNEASNQPSTLNNGAEASWNALRTVWLLEDITLEVPLFTNTF